jgi:molybdopterin synthase catalytic subunit
MIEVRIQAKAFDMAAEMTRVTGGGAGALASFIGIVRNDDGVTAIELEHYPAMTEASLRALAQDATGRWALTGCLLIHRVGRMDVGEAIVLVVTAALHRAAALDACAFLIDRLKTDAPFWKKEYRGAVASWVEPKISDADRAVQWS